MPRFYFNIRSGHSIIRDEEGEDHDSLASAEKEAIASAREIIADAIRTDVAKARNKRFELTDESGTVVSSIDFADLLKEP